MRHSESSLSINSLFLHFLFYFFKEDLYFNRTMETVYRYFPVILLCLSFHLFSYAWCSPMDVYGKVVELVSPGEEYLDEMSVRSFFKLLEKRVQCPGVSCEKVTFFLHSLQLGFRKGRGPTCTCYCAVRYTQWNTAMYIYHSAFSDLVC